LGGSGTKYTSFVFPLWACARPLPKRASPPCPEWFVPLGARSFVELSGAGECRSDYFFFFEVVDGVSRSSAR